MITKALSLAAALLLGGSGVAHAAVDPPPAPAQRISSTSAAAPEDPVAHVNSLSYNYQDIDPAIEAFQWVAKTRGWSLHDIAAWQPFVRGIIARESGGCWNLRRGARLAGNGEGCVITRQGRYTDSGFGQILMSVNGKWLCAQEGLCAPSDVVSSPWNSMVALVAEVERAGRGPWCYTTKLRRGAICRSAP